MYTQVAEQWLAHQPRLEPLQRQFLEKALRFYESFAQEKSADPAFRLETAQAYRRVAEIQKRLGQTVQSEKAFQEAIDRFEKLAAEFPSKPEYRQVLADTLANFWVLLSNTGRYPDEEKARRALVIEEKLVADFPGVPEYRAVLGRGYCHLGIFLNAMRRWPERDKAFGAALEIQKKLVSDFPSVPQYRQDLANTHRALGNFGKPRPFWKSSSVIFPTSPIVAAGWVKSILGCQKKGDFQPKRRRSFSKKRCSFRKNWQPIIQALPITDMTCCAA